jgi:hypothetical protein
MTLRNISLCKSNKSFNTFKVIDFIALCGVLFVILAYYYPEHHPLQSRYLRMAGAFERSAFIINPGYDGTFHRYPGEAMFPFLTLASRISISIFRDSLPTAILVMVMSIVRVATIATFGLSRLYLSTLTTSWVTIFLFCGRVVMPIARGIGNVSMLLMFPFSLVFVHALPKTMDSTLLRWKRWLWIGVAGSSFGAIYYLGSHESIFGLFCVAVGGAIGLALWAWRSNRAGHLLPWRRGIFTSMAIAGSAFAIVIILALVLRHGMPEAQNPANFLQVLTLERMRVGAKDDVLVGLDYPLESKPDLLYATFVAGRYPLDYVRRRHEDTFLSPGSGFNGILPIFLFLGFVLGLREFYRRVRTAMSRSEQLEHANDDYFLLLLATQLIAFVVAVVLIEDPKPTRFTFSVYAIYILTIWGYQALAGWLAERIKSPTLSRWAVSSLWIALCVLSGLRLVKNYRDLQTYKVEFAHQIPTIALQEILDGALSNPDQHIRIYGPEAMVTYPAIGMWLRFRVPDNLELVWDQQDLADPPPGARLFYMVAPSYNRGYYEPYSRWKDDLLYEAPGEVVWQP